MDIIFFLDLSKKEVFYSQSSEVRGLCGGHTKERVGVSKHTDDFNLFRFHYCTTT